MRLKTLLAPLAALVLSGCFISEEPLIGEEEASFPYERITYAEVNNGVRLTMNHRDGWYRVVAPDDPSKELRLRFRQVGDGYYVALAEFEEDGARRILYSLMKVDFAARRADSYVGIAPDETVEAPGLSQCKVDAICVEDINAFVDYARKAIDAGRPPDTSYDIIALE